MSISLIWIGKTKPDYIQKGISEYLKRLQSYTKIDIITVREVSLSSCENIEQVKEKEAYRLEKHIDKKNFNIALDENGEEMTSLKFSEMIRDLQGKNISMFIGGVYGFDASFLEQCDKIISLSQMTMTHQMIRLVLLEQLYRGFTIINNKKYHY